jgi:hypothetical protein
LANKELSRRAWLPLRPSRRLARVPVLAVGQSQQCGRKDQVRITCYPPTQSPVHGLSNPGTDMRHRTASVALVATLATTALANAEECDLQRAHLVCVPNQEPGAIEQFLDRFRKTVDRALTPPGGWKRETAVPPAPVLQDSGTRSGQYQGSRPLPQEQRKNAIIAEAERFCALYPTDPVCHFRDQAPSKPSR